jgi:hypothetical protein
MAAAGPSWQTTASHARVSEGSPLVQLLPLQRMTTSHHIALFACIPACCSSQPIADISPGPWTQCYPVSGLQRVHIIGAQREQHNQYILPSAGLKPLPLAILPACPRLTQLAGKAIQQGITEQPMWWGNGPAYSDCNF